MAAKVRCTNCGLSLEVPDEVQESWLTCPRCQEKLVNPTALRRGPMTRLTWEGAVGTALMLMSVLGCVCVGPATALLEGWTAAMRRVPYNGAWLITNGVLCAFAFGAGVLFVRAGEGKGKRTLLLLGGLAAALAALLLLVVSGLIVVYATCFSGR